MIIYQYTEVIYNKCTSYITNTLFYTILYYSTLFYTIAITSYIRNEEFLPLASITTTTITINLFTAFYLLPTCLFRVMSPACHLFPNQEVAYLGNSEQYPTYLRGFPEGRLKPRDLRVISEQSPSYYIQYITILYIVQQHILYTIQYSYSITLIYYIQYILLYIVDYIYIYIQTSAQPTLTRTQPNPTQPKMGFGSIAST